jgi:hypothetical protein
MAYTQIIGPSLRFNDTLVRVPYSSENHHLVYINERYEAKTIPLVLAGTTVTFVGGEAQSFNCSLSAKPNENYLAIGLIINGSFVSSDKLMSGTTFPEGYFNCNFNLKPIEIYLMSSTNVDFKVPTVHFRTANSLYQIEFDLDNS